MGIVVAAKGTSTDKNTDQLFTPVTSGFEVGDTAVICTSSDTPITVVRISSGNNATKDAEAVNSGNVIVAIWSRHNIDAFDVAALNQGGSYISNANTDAKALAFYRVTGLDNSPFDKSATDTGSGTSASSGATTALSQADELIFGAIGVEDEVDDMTGTWTTGAGYVSGNEQQDGTNGAGDASNITIYAAAEVVAATTAQEAEVTGMDSIDWAAAVATYKGVVSAVSDPAMWIGRARMTARNTLLRMFKRLEVSYGQNVFGFFFGGGRNRNSRSV